MEPSSSQAVPMKTTPVIAATVLWLATATAWAQAAPSTCEATASEKKLAGAARTSFMKKCESDARARCDTAAAEKKLAGAAKNSFTRKCVKDAVGESAKG